MSFNAANIRTAILELLEGDIGAIRTVSADTFEYGVFDGLSQQAVEGKLTASSASHMFDVAVSVTDNHPNTNSPNTGSRRLMRARVSIPIWTRTKTTAEESARKTTLASIRDDADTALQALGYPGNLTETSASAATNIRGGLLYGPGGTGGPAWSIESVDWERGIVRSHIDALALVDVSQTSPAVAPNVTFDGQTVIWLRGDTLTLNASDVSLWDDKNGTFTGPDQSSPSLQPAYEATGGAESTPIVTSDGTEYVRGDESYRASGESWTAYVVVKPINITVTDIVMTFGDSSSLRVSTSNFFLRGFGAVDAVAAEAVTEGQWYAVRARVDYGNDIQGIRVNNGTEATATQTGTEDADRLTLFSNHSGGGGLNGSIAEVFIASIGEPTNAQDTAMNNYLNDRYGMSL